MKILENKVVLVTGGSSGLGAATALALASKGAKVSVAARRREAGEDVVRQIEKSGGEAIFVQADVTQRADVEAMVAQTVERFGGLDGAVNNAGVSGRAMTPVADIQEADWDATLNTNLKAVWMCMKYEIPALLARGKGAIVNISSIYGLEPSDIGHAPYCVSKFGVVGLTKSAAIDYGDKGVRVNAVCPGYSHSEMVDRFAKAKPDMANAVTERHSAMHRLGESNEIAQTVAWLCSDEASFVNGVALPVQGGETKRLY